MYNYFNIKEHIKPDEILVYLRKSRADDPLLSVEEVLQKHETILDEFCERTFGEKISENNKFREIVSGETIADRPEVQKVLRLAESPKIKAILVVEVQRLSRGDLEDAGRLIKLLRYSETLVITPPKIYDLKDEYDRDSFERELKRGNEFLEYQKKIMNRGRLLSVSQGNFIGSIPPYGYDKIWVKDGKNEYPTLTANKEQADVVRMIFDLYVNKNMGYQRICNTLNDLKIAPPKGEIWSSASLKGTLVNIHYIGMVKWNWRKTMTTIEDGEVVKTRPKARMGEYLVYNGKHEGIVPEELFNAAQEKLGKNTRTPASKEVKNALASLLFCRCGRAMTLRCYKNKDGSERCSPRLICDAQRTCNTGSCTYDELIGMVGDILEKNIREFEAKLNHDEDNSAKNHQKVIKNLEKKLKDLQAKELSQWEAQSDPNPENRMPQEIFKQLNAKLIKEKEEVQQALQKAHESIPEQINYKEKIVKFKDALSALNNPKVNAGEKNRLLKQCIERIEYSRERPERLSRNPGEKKGTVFATTGGHWSNPPIVIDVKLNV